MPITIDLLRALVTELNKSDDPEDLVIKAAACVAFSGFLRAGEFTTASTAFDRNWDLARCSISFHPHAVAPAYMSLTLPGSKTDPTRKGVTIIIAAVPDSLTCPVAAVQAMGLAFPGSGPNSPLFQMADGTPLRKEVFVSRVRLFLGRAGHNSSEYTGHSFRRGAATTAGLAGYRAHEIQQMGRWVSDAYKLYLDTPTERLVRLSQNLHMAH